MWNAAERAVLRRLRRFAFKHSNASYIVLGPQGETLSNLQLPLLVEEEPGVSPAEVEAEA